MTPSSRVDTWRATRTAIAPLLIDVAIPTGLYYALTAVGIASTPALVAGGVIPFVRALYSTIRAGKPDPLAAMMAALFALGLALAAITGSPRALLLRESFGTVLLGAWFLATLLTGHPITEQVARPVLTQGRPDLLAAWDRLSGTAPQFRAAQRRLTALWGLGLLAEAAVRVAIVLHYPVHTAAGLVHVGALGVIGLLCMLSGPAGGLRLHRLLTQETAKPVHAAALTQQS